MSRPVVVAHVGRARGLRGDVVVHGEPDELALVAGASRVLLDVDGGWTEVDADALAPVKDGLVLRLGGITDRAGAEALRGAAVAIDAETLPPPSLDGWVWLQIEGFEVVTSDGRSLGTVTGRIRTGATDVLVVTEGDREVLIPASPTVLKEMDGAGRRLVIEPIPGLLELNE